MQRHLITFLALVLTTLSTLSHAEEINARYRTVDLGIGVGQGFSSTTNIFTNETKSNWLGAAVDAGIGYQHNKWLGVEAGAIYMNNINDNNENFRFNYFALRMMFPIQQRFNFILKYGAATDASVTAGTPFGGIGLGYRLNEHWSARLTYQGLVTTLVGAGSVSLGINYQI